MTGRPNHVPGPNNHDTRRYLPQRLPSFAGYERLPLLPPPPTYRLPSSVHHRHVAMNGRLWEITSPNSLLDAFCPGLRPTNLNLRVDYFIEENRRYDGHMGPFDATRNPQLCVPGKEWRALIVSPAAGNPRDSPEYESILNCWKSDGPPAFDTGSVINGYIDNLIRANQETDRRIEALYRTHLDYHSFDPVHIALWKSGIRPFVPSSEYLDTLRRHNRFSLFVDFTTEAQRGIKDKRAFVDYVSRLQQTRSWIPDPEAEVGMADDRYLGVWLNGMEERQARWYLKEGIPCYVAREVPSRERAKIAALETMIDFAAGTNASSIHWNVNEYDTLAITRGDLLVTNTTRSFDPGWIWPTITSNNDTPDQLTEVVNYEPPPLTTVVVDADRIPWIKPPPVQKAEPSLPGAPPHERKRWRKFKEEYDPENTFVEVSPKKDLDHRYHSMYDRERRWQILFLRPPKAPPGCVSDVNVFGQPCPEGVYKDMSKRRRRLRRPAWIYNRMEPRTSDIRREAPIPRPEELPLIRGPIPPAPGDDDDDDDDDDYYPSFDFGIQPSKDDETVSEQAAKSATDYPAAPVMGPETAATGATTSPTIVMEGEGPPVISPIIPSESRRSEDEVSLGDEDPVGEAMGPQIPAMVPMEDIVMRENVAVAEDPLEFATSCLMIYGIPLSVDFEAIRTIVSNFATQLHLSVHRIFRTSVGRNQSFWLETESVSQARQLRNFMHHRREDGIELLVSYADHEDYVGALGRATNTWPAPIDPIPQPGLGPTMNQPPAASSSVSGSQARRRSRDRWASRSPDRNRRERRSPSRARYHSPTRTAYPRYRYRRSPSPYYRRRSPRRRSNSPPRRRHRSSRSPSPPANQDSTSHYRTAPSHSIRETVQASPIPVIPSVPAASNLPPGAPLPFGANIAFMWSPSGNTLSPVLLQGNTTILPYHMPPSGPTPSALLPWPIAATLPAAVPDSSPNESVPSLASRITGQVNSPSVSFPSEEPQPTLMTRMTNNLAARLRDPVRSIPLSSRLTDSRDLSSRLSDAPAPSLVDRLNSNESMDVENPLAITPMIIDDPHLAAINDVMATAGPLVLDPVQYDNPWRPGDPDDEDEEEDEPMEEVGWKKTKRGRRSGRRIQNIRRRDEEREDRQRRRQRRF